MDERRGHNERTGWWPQESRRVVMVVVVVVVVVEEVVVEVVEVEVGGNLHGQPKVGVAKLDFYAQALLHSRRRGDGSCPALLLLSFHYWYYYHYCPCGSTFLHQRKLEEQTGLVDLFLAGCLLGDWDRIIGEGGSNGGMCNLSVNQSSESNHKRVDDDEGWELVDVG